MFGHRFAEIHQARSLDQIGALWAALGDSETTPITVSNICEKLLNKVQSSTLNFKDALLHLQNLALTSTHKLKTSIFLRSISLLIQLHAKDTVIGEAIEFEFSTSAKTLQHPYTVLCRQRPELRDTVYLEIDFLLNEWDEVTYDNTILGSLDTFFDSIFLSADITQGRALLGRFANAYPSTELHIDMFLYLCDVLRRYPTKRGLPLYLQMVDSLMAVFQRPEVPEEDLKSIATDVFYQLLSRAYDAATNGEPTLPFLQRLYQIYQTNDIHSNQRLASPNPFLLWTGLAYLLMTVQTVQDQDVVLNLMNNVIDLHSLGVIALTAVLPLFQVWAEVVEEDATTRLRKSVVLDLLSLTNKAVEGNAPEKQTVLKSIEEDIKAHSLSGSIAHLIPHLDDCLSGNLNTDTIPQTKLSHIHALIFTTPHVFNQTIHLRHKAMTRIATLATMMTEVQSFKFPVFILLLYLMRSHNSIAGETFLFIYYSILPTLLDVNDPIITSKILQIILPMIQGGSSTQLRDSTMATIGFKVLAKMYEHQPRVWHELKRVITNWILHRKSTYHPDDPKALQMELAILTTIRDLCKHHYRECAQDLLPMVISLLQTCNNLNIASISIIVQVINACIRAELAEPRSMWVVAVNYIASFAMTIDQNQAAVLWESICDFFSLAGDKEEVSEPYLEFKETIFTEYLELLIAAESHSIRSAALTALSHFEASDIQRLLPEKAKQFTEQIINAPDPAHSTVLTKLMSHELDHMRRGLFKEETPSGKTSDEAQALKRSTKNSIGRKESEVGDLIVAEWEQARTPPGLRSGYAIALIHVTGGHMMDRKSTGDSLSKSKWYRSMSTSLADINLSDHLMLRVSCVQGWVSVFEAALGSEQSTFELKGAQILKDLLARLDKSTVPGVTCNTLLALAGFTVAATRLSSSFGASCATQVVDAICSRFILPDNQIGSSMPTLFMSDEAQFGAYFSLGYVASCAVSNEKVATRILSLLLEAATTNETGRGIDTVVDLVQYARGFAAGHFTAALATWPTKTQGIDQLGKNGLSTLLEYCNAPAQRVSESRALGILMGWASKIQVTEIRDVSWFATETLKMYIDSGRAGINRGVLLGSCWVAGYADTTNLDNNSLGVLEKALNKASKDTGLATNTYHFSIPFAHLQRRHMLQNPSETETSEKYMGLIRNASESIRKGDRITAILTLGSLLGVDYLDPSSDPEMLLEGAQKYDSGSRLDALGALTTAANLTAPAGTAMIGDLRSARIAAAVCGKLSHVANDMRNTSLLDHDTGNVNSVMLSASNEPKTYARLSNTTSYLRAVFDSLVELVRYPNPQSIQTMDILLRSLCDTPGALPPVNWFQLLVDLSAISQQLHNTCVAFASTHAATSVSLTEFIVSELNISDPGVQRALVSELGLGKVLELSGLPNLNATDGGFKRRGMDAVTTKTKISEMRCIEIYEPYAKRLSRLPYDIQITLLTTLCDHLPPLKQDIADEHTALLVTTLRDMTYFNFTRPLVTQDTVKLAGPKLTALVDKAVEASIVDQIKLGQLTKENALVHTTALAEMCRLGRTADSATQWITESIRQLVVQGVTDSNCWQQILKAMKVSDCLTDRDKLGWVTRMLDTLIVIAGDKSIQQDLDVVLGDALSRSLRYILSGLWWWLDVWSTQEPRAASFLDTSFMLASAISFGDKYRLEQQQVVKRVLKSIALTENSDGITQTLISVLRQCSVDAISQQSTENILRILAT